MSIFNLVAGYDPLAAIVLDVMFHDSPAKDAQDALIPSFRDAYVDMDEDENPRLVILTRTGGKLRAENTEQNDYLTTLPGFVRDYDDAFDPTFAHWVYDIPPEMKDRFRVYIERSKSVGYDFPKPLDRFRKAARMQAQADAMLLAEETLNDGDEWLQPAGIPGKPMTILDT